MNEFGRQIVLFCGGLILLSALISFASIVLRLAAHISFDLTTDVMVWITVWAALLAGAPLAITTGAHISIRTVVEKLRGRAGRYVLVGGQIISAGICALTAYAGWLYVASLYEREVTFVRDLDVPHWVVKLSVPVSITLVTVFCLVALRANLRGDHSESSE